MDKTIHIDKKAGVMFITTAQKEIFSNTPITVLGEEIFIGNKTTLSGFFDVPVEYCGIYDGFATFYLGITESDSSSLFDDALHYYELLHITDDRHIAQYLQERCANNYTYNEKLGIWK